MKKNIIITITTLIILSIFNSVYSAPAYPYPIKYTQPDGTPITIQLRGDEKVNWAETLDGYTILVTNKGYYEYAVIDKNGDLTFSGIRVSDREKRAVVEIDFLKNLPKGLFFSKRQVELKKSMWDAKSVYQKSFPATGHQRMLCILMQTPDKPFTKTQEDFDALFNQLDYTLGGASGSVKDYYLENSYGQFDLSVDVVGPYTAEKDMSHYGSTWAGARELATEAVQLAHPDVDYTDYDNSNNGWVDGIYMIFAGYGEEAGGGPGTIWSHAWSINAVQLDGKWISRYACSPELRGNSGTNITRIGVIGHEFGHVLGAPDYYDTDGENSGGNYIGTGRWDMMASGTWNNGGATPAHHNPYTKVVTYNWADIKTLNQPESIVMYSTVADKNSFYRVNTARPGEYFILENRHKVEFDSSLPGEGLIIYHVHPQVAASGNSVNVGHPQKMYTVCAGAISDPEGAPATYGNVNSDETPFPGSTNQTEFTDQTFPSSRSWALRNTNKPITSISVNSEDKTVSFDFMVGSEEISDWLHWDDGNNYNTIGLQNPGTLQIAKRFDTNDLENYKGFKISNIRVLINNSPTSAKIKIWQGEDQYSLVKMMSQEFTPEESSWNVIELDEPYLINYNKELWFGVEAEITSTSIRPFGRDIVTNADGKGNMVRTDTTSHDNWVPLSSYEVWGDWNIQALVEKEEHELKVFTEPSVGGTVEVNPEKLEYYPGEIITLKAIPEEGYTFLNWRIDEVAISSDAEFSFTMPDKSVDIFAHFAENSAELFSINIESNTPDAGVLIGSGFFQADESIAVLAIANSGKKFIEWTDENNNSLSNQSKYQFLMPSNDLILIANFVDVFNVLFEVFDENEDAINNAIITLSDIENETGNYLFNGIESGTYSFTVNKESYFPKTGSITITNEDLTKKVYLTTDNTSNEQVIIDEIKIYPNPARDLINISTAEKIIQIRLINLNGQIINEFEVNDFYHQLNTTNYMSGSYLLQIMTKSGVKNKVIGISN